MNGLRINEMNPFEDPEHRSIWEILVHHDIEGFIRQDWSLCEADFLETGFVGIDGCFSDDPDNWELTYPNLESYRIAWLSQSREFASHEYTENPRDRLFTSMKLAWIKINGPNALALKIIDGSIRRVDGEEIQLSWQSLFLCRKVDGCWKINGFVGYLPHSMGSMEK